MKSLSDVRLEMGKKGDRKKTGMMSFLAWDNKL
jgi:hypothetical protein